MSSESIHQELASGTSVTENYYKLFGVKPNASDESIKEIWRMLAKEYHPDRSNHANDAVFSKLAQAYQVLSDPIARALYDISKGYKKDTSEERAKINKMKRNQAIKLVETSEATVAQIREEEQCIDGLIIFEALYGDISVDADAITSETAAGRCIDVAIPLQLSVKTSLLFKHGCDSMAYLDGFYDPNDKEIENLLYVRYQFQGCLHEVVYRDTDAICIPLEEHLIPESELECCTYADTDTEDEDETPKVPKQRSKLRNVTIKPIAQKLKEIQAVKAARRRKLYNVLGYIGVTASLYYLNKWDYINIKEWSPVKTVMSLITGNKEEEPVTEQEAN